jgi:hypothetical protein
MPVTTDQPAPYAPASAILELIERHRNKGLPSVVDADVLQRAGISDSLVPRTLQALKILDLLDSEGRPTQVFEGIRLAPTAEYQQRLIEWLNAAYADALAFVDPATDDEVAFRDAFRKYTPTGQQSRMVSLFMGLFSAAGVLPTRPKAPTQRSTSGSPSSRVPKARVVSRQINKPIVSAERTSLDRTQHAGISNLPPAIAGLLATLPTNTGIWTKERRDSFLATFGAVLDYTFQIGQPEEPTMETATDQ